MHHETPRAARGLLMLLVLALVALACGNIPQEPDTQATVAAFYATITAQAASGQPFPTRVVETQQAPGTDEGDDATDDATNTPDPTNTPPPEGRSGNGLNFAIPRCGGEIQVDGDDGDWGFYRGMVVTHGEPTFGDGEWQNTADLHGESRQCWTDAGLYLVMVVTDDIHVQTESGIRAWQGDEVEVLFDSDMLGDYYEDETNDDDSHFGLNPGNFDGIAPVGVQYVPDQNESPGILVAARRPIGVGAGYTLEALIPWRLTGITVPQANTPYGMCIAVSDNDHINTSQQDTMVSHCTELLTPDPTTWVTVNFTQ